MNTTPHNSEKGQAIVYLVIGLVVFLGFVALAAVEGSFTYFSGRMAAYTAENITRRLRNYLYDHIQRLPFAYGGKINNIDPARQSPLIKYIYSVLPQPNIPGVNPLVGANYSAPNPNIQDQYTWSSRFDPGDPVTPQAENRHSPRGPIDVAQPRARRTHVTGRAS